MNAAANGKTAMILRKQPDDKWRIIVDRVNSDRRAATPVAKQERLETEWMDVPFPTIRLIEKEEVVCANFLSP
jgi:hypothetical protein